jgi:hypothetical protein
MLNKADSISFLALENWYLLYPRSLAATLSAYKAASSNGLDSSSSMHCSSFSVERSFLLLEVDDLIDLVDVDDLADLVEVLGVGLGVANAVDGRVGEGEDMTSESIGENADEDSGGIFSLLGRLVSVLFKKIGIIITLSAVIKIWEMNFTLNYKLLH